MTGTDDRTPAPITPATFHILLTLAQEVSHGYGIKRTVEERTDGAVRLGAGTLYAGLQRMTDNRLIEESDPPEDTGDAEPSERWRFYRIPPRGREVLRAEVARLEADLEVARAVVAREA